MASPKLPPAAAAPEPAAPADPQVFPLSLDEFCARLSVKCSRVALIGGFYYDAKQRGLTQALESEFVAAWDAFIVAPAD